MVDGLSSLAQYTGTVLALQDAADVPFPNLGGGTADLFAPGDKLLDPLDRRNRPDPLRQPPPENPPVGVAAPGDAVYCAAVTPEGVGTVSNVSWSTNRGDGTVVTPVAPLTTAGAAPTGRGAGQRFGRRARHQRHLHRGRSAARGHRPMPHTVQDVVRRIEEIGGSEADAL